MKVPEWVEKAVEEEFTSDAVLRFCSKFTGGSEDQCWIWSTHKNQKGYGRFYYCGRNRLAHHFSWIRANGPIPDGLEIDHVCRNRACVNPAHLRAVTHHENLMSGDTLPAHAVTQTHCTRGHEFTPENTYMWNGERRCRACAKAKEKRRRDAYKEQHGHPIKHTWDKRRTK